MRVPVPVPVLLTVGRDRRVGRRGINWAGHDWRDDISTIAVAAYLGDVAGGQLSRLTGFCLLLGAPPFASPPFPLADQGAFGPPVLMRRAKSDD